MSSRACEQTIAAGGCLVLAPGLLSGAHASDSQVSAGLCRLLGFAEQSALPESDQLSVESLVACNLLPAASAGCAATLTYVKDFPATTDDPLAGGTVMRADPAYQQIDMNNATLGNPRELGLTTDECDALQQTLNNHFADEGIYFESKEPQRWYCRFKEPLQVTTTPVSAAIGRDVARCRPDGVDARQWRSKLAEIEMLLYDHPVNTARQQNNKLPVNTLWLWGEGKPAKNQTSAGVSVFTDNFYTKSVSEYIGVNCHNLPATSSAFETTDGPVLIVIDHFTFADSSTDSRIDKMQWFDQVICEQLWYRLKSTASGFSELAIWCGDNRLFVVRAAVKKQLFRRLFYKPKQLTAYLPDDGLPGDIHVDSLQHPERS